MRPLGPLRRGPCLAGVAQESLTEDMGFMPLGKEGLQQQRSNQESQSGCSRKAKKDSASQLSPGCAHQQSASEAMSVLSESRGPPPAPDSAGSWATQARRKGGGPAGLRDKGDPCRQRRRLAGTGARTPVF